LRKSRFDERQATHTCKLLILLGLWVWLDALDDVRNWLIREAA